MSQLIPPFGGDPGGEPPEIGLTDVGDPRLDRELQRREWEAATARYRALALARAVFGPGARLEGTALRPGPFRGLLHLRVPFASLADHRRRERIFQACAARDEVLGRLPFVFVFAPRPGVAPVG